MRARGEVERERTFYDSKLIQAQNLRVCRYREIIRKKQHFDAAKWQKYLIDDRFEIAQFAFGGEKHTLNCIGGILPSKTPTFQLELIIISVS